MRFTKAKGKGLMSWLMTLGLDTDDEVMSPSPYRESLGHDRADCCDTGKVCGTGILSVCAVSIPSSAQKTGDVTFLHRRMVRVES